MKAKSRRMPPLWTILAQTRWTRSSWSWPSKKRLTLRFRMKTRRRSGPSKMPSTILTSTRKAASNLARRVVVTGLGLICDVGHTSAEVWKNIVAGKSGVTRISRFEPSDLACQIAAEVKDFAPLNFVEKKEVKKMGCFIHLALAAADEAMKMCGLQITPENATRVGVHIGSGVGGFDVIEREHAALLAGGPRQISPFFIPASIVNLAAGHVSIRYGAKGPNEAAYTACTT